MNIQEYNKKLQEALEDCRIGEEGVEETLKIIGALNKEAKEKGIDVNVSITEEQLQQSRDDYVEEYYESSESSEYEYSEEEDEEEEEEQKD